MPNTRILLLDGNYISLNNLADNKDLVVAFWAEWCAKSRKRVQALDEIAKAKRDYQFIAISLDPESHFNKLQEFIKYKNLNNLIHAFSGNEGADEAFQSFRAKLQSDASLPQLFVIKNRKIVAFGNDVGIIQ